MSGFISWAVPLLVQFRPATFGRDSRSVTPTIVRDDGNREQGLRKPRIAEKLPASGKSHIDGPGGLPYKPRQSRRFRPLGLIRKCLRFNLKILCPALRRFPRETDLSAEQIGAQTPSRLSRPDGDQSGRKVLAARRARGRKRLSASDRACGTFAPPIDYALPISPKPSSKSQPCCTHGAVETPDGLSGCRPGRAGARRRSCCRRCGAEAPMTPRSASASRCRGRSAMRWSAIACGAACANWCGSSRQRASRRPRLRADRATGRARIRRSPTWRGNSIRRSAAIPCPSGRNRCAAETAPT